MNVQRHCSICGKLYDPAIVLLFFLLVVQERPLPSFNTEHQWPLRV